MVSFKIIVRPCARQEAGSQRENNKSGLLDYNTAFSYRRDRMGSFMNFGGNSVGRRGSYGGRAPQSELNPCLGEN